MKMLLTTLLFAFAILLQSNSCKKIKSTNTCELGGCDPSRKTVAIASDWSGQLGYYNDLRKWTINYHIPGSYDSIMTCIICVDIPDSLKSIGKFVAFSGNIKEGCDYPKPTFHGQGIFYINPTILH